MLQSLSKLHTRVDGKRDRERDGDRCSVLVGDDILQGEGGSGGLQGLRPGQNSTVLVDQNVDIPVPHDRGGRVGRGGL